MYELKDYVNAINFEKKPLLDTEDLTWEKKYPPFIINKCLSMFYDCIAQANEMNGYHFLGKDVQFNFFINSILNSCYNITVCNNITFTSQVIK